VDQTEWHDLELWGPQAKIAEQFLKKGSQIYVEGKIKSDTWQDDQGQNRKRTKIRVLSFTMLGGKSESMNGMAANTSSSTSTAPVQKESASMSGAGGPDISMDDAEDDLPF
jgi:single-strand DNA-binding protein